jgi:cytochrome b pre-mRNA-processing protein 3
MVFSQFFREPPHAIAARALYVRIVEQSREPALYAVMGVPDSVDGRFEALVLHAGIVMRRMTREGGPCARVSQALFDLMFQDLDENLREMGVGDISVPRKIKAMGEAFYGRSKAYDAALEGADRAALSAALRRNIHNGEDRPGLDALANYTRKLYDAMQAQPVETFLDGRLDFPILTHA